MSYTIDKFCPNCGQRNDGNMPFCMNCNNGLKRINNSYSERKINGANEVIGSLGIIYSIMYGLSAFLPYSSFLGFGYGGIFDTYDFLGVAAVIMAIISLVAAIIRNKTLLSVMGVIGIIVYVIVIFIYMKNYIGIFTMEYFEIGAYGLIVSPAVLLACAVQNDDSTIPKFLSVLFAIVYIGSIFLPIYSGSFGSVYTIYSSYTVLGIIIIGVAIVSIIATFFEADLVLRIIGSLGSGLFIIGLIFVIVTYMTQSVKYSISFFNRFMLVLKGFGTGAYGLMFCPLSIWLCGIAVHNDKIKRERKLRTEEYERERKKNGTWICSRCRVVNPQYVGLCRCGNRKPDMFYAGMTLYDEATENTVCSYCGDINKDSALFCKRCGQKILKVNGSGFYE